MKKIIFLLFFFLVSLSPQISFAYQLTNTDKKIIQNIETKLEHIFETYPDLSKAQVKKIFTSKKANTNNVRLASILWVLIKNLETPKIQKVTILEWWNIFDIDEYLAKKSLIKPWEYISYVQNPEKIKALSKFFPFLWTQKTLEWYLYPDTYEIETQNFQINMFVIKQLEAFETKVYNNVFKDKYSNDITESVVNLASIVEKEEKQLSQKPIIAGILKKRLKKYWHIWADATTCYPYKLTSNQCKLSISKYIKQKTDYNTRFVIWLPPTPIWNPSFETINATLNHTETKYFYYLHDTKTGKAYYAKTNAEHNQNKKKYLQK